MSATATRSKKPKRAAAPLPPRAVIEWRVVTLRLAAGVGALCGLVSLLYDAPPWVACVRAGGASFLIAALAHLGEYVVRSSPPRRRADEGDDRGPVSSDDPAVAAGAEPGR